MFTPVNGGRYCDEACSRTLGRQVPPDPARSEHARHPPNPEPAPRPSQTPSVHREAPHAGYINRRESQAVVYLPIPLPRSAAFVLDQDSGMLTIPASALGTEDQVLATVNSTTTIMHGKTWTVGVDFGGTAAAN